MVLPWRRWWLVHLSSALEWADGIRRRRTTVRRGQRLDGRATASVQTDADRLKSTDRCMTTGSQTHACRCCDRPPSNSAASPGNTTTPDQRTRRACLRSNKRKNAIHAALLQYGRNPTETILTLRFSTVFAIFGCSQKKYVIIQTTGSKRDLSTISHCLEWYKLVLRTRLPTLAVRHIAHNAVL